MATEKFPIRDLSSIGLISDINPAIMNVSGFQQAFNVRFKNGAVEAAKGYEEYIPTAFLQGTASETYQLVQGVGTDLYIITDEKSYRMRHDGVTEIEEPTSWAKGRVVDHIHTTSFLPIAMVDNLPYMLKDDSGKLSWEILPKFGSNRECSTIYSYKGFLVSIGNEVNQNLYRDTIFISDVAGPGFYPSDWGFEIEGDGSGHIDLTKPITASKGGTFELNSVGGSLTAACELGDHLYLFTESEIFELTFIGGLDNFSARKVIQGYGALGPDSVTPVEGGILVVSPTDIYIFDGSKVTSLSDNRISQIVNNTISPDSKIKVVRDFHEKEVFVYINNDGHFDMALVWDWVTNTWSVRDASFGEFTYISEYNTGSLLAQQLDTWGNVGETWDSIGNTSWSEGAPSGVGLLAIKGKRLLQLNVGYNILASKTEKVIPVPWKLRRTYYLGGAIDDDLIYKVVAVKPVVTLASNDQQLNITVNHALCNRRGNNFFTLNSAKNFDVSIFGKGQAALSAFDIEHQLIGKR